MVGGVVPVAERLVVQRDGDGAAFPGFQVHPGKALEFLGGAEDFGVRLGDVDLHDLIPGALAGVFHRQGHPLGRGGQVPVGEGGVAQPVAEGERHRHTGGLIVAVAHIQALAVFHGAARTAEVLIRRVVLAVHRPGLGQLAAGVGLAGQHVQQGARPGLAAQPRPDQRLAMALPAGLHGAAAAEHHRHMGVGAVYRQQQVQLVLGQLHAAAVHAFALLNLIQTQEQQHHVGFGRQFHRLGLQGRVGLAEAVKALGIAHAVQTALAESLQKAVHPGDVDHAGARALVAGGSGKIADDRHPGRRVQGQQTGLVFQQHDAFFRRLAGQGVVGVPVNGLGGLVQRLGGGVRQGQQFLQPGIDVRLRDFALPHGFHQFPHRVQARGGHFQGGTVLDAQGVVVGPAPVGDDGAGKAPGVPQDLFDQVGVLVGVGAVDQIVAGHDGPGFSLGNGDLEVGQVEFPQGALIHHRIGGHAAQFLAVGGKMLGAGGHAVCLDAADVRGGHLAGKVGIFGKIFKVAAAQRAALGVEAGPQHNGHLLGGGFLPQRTADLFPKGFVPA